MPTKPRRARAAKPTTGAKRSERLESTVNVADATRPEPTINGLTRTQLEAQLAYAKERRSWSAYDAICADLRELDKLGKPDKPAPRKGGVGVVVRYCGHNATFLADIYEVGGACVVVAAEPITDSTGLFRPARGAERHLIDFPMAGYWKPRALIQGYLRDQSPQVAREANLIEAITREILEAIDLRIK